MTALKYKCLDAYNTILEKFKGCGCISVDIMKRLDKLKDYGNDYVVYKWDIDVSSLSSDQIKQIIGKDGCYFKITTEATDTDFIWHNTDKKVFEFWGPYDNIKNAIPIIQNRIQIYTAIPTPIP